MIAVAVRETLRVAVAAMKPWSRRDDAAAYALALRIQRLEPMPDGFVPIDEAEAAQHYFARLRPEGHRVPSLDDVVISDAEAENLYLERIIRHAS